MFSGNWSFSSLMSFEACPQRFKLAKVDKLKGPDRPPDNPMERGNRIHKRYEDYIKGDTEVFDTEAKNGALFRHHFDHLRELHATGVATAEQDWLFNRNWELTGKNFSCNAHEDYVKGCGTCEARIWLWAKLDASVYDKSEKLAIAIDFKTGKSTYKAVEHIQQLQLYAAISALKFPDAERIATELWYVDEGWIRQIEYTTDQALTFVGRYQLRADRIYNEKLFRANPSRDVCRYCDFGPKNGTGVCPVGV